MNPTPTQQEAAILMMDPDRCVRRDYWRSHPAQYTELKRCAGVAWLWYLRHVAGELPAARVLTRSEN